MKKEGEEIGKLDHKTAVVVTIFYLHLNSGSACLVSLDKAEYDAVRGGDVDVEFYCSALLLPCCTLLHA